MSGKSYAHVLVALLVGILVGTTHAQTTWYVDDDAPGDPGPGDPAISDPAEDGSADHPFDAIQEGINAAVDGDMVLVLDGTYTGDGNRDLDFGGRLITVRSENGPETCIIDCQANESDAHRGFHFQSGETADAVLGGFTISNGYADTGGGVKCLDSSPTINNCTFSGNLASGSGAGMHNDGGAPRLADCMFAGNVASYGGGMYNHDGGAQLVNCTFDGNIAWAGVGGAICNSESSVTLTDCLLTGNAASGAGGVERGGGIYNELSRVELVNCTITQNQADYTGGGVACMRRSETTLINCTISHNTADI
jgi:parallel beta-helix repeat protein